MAGGCVEQRLEKIEDSLVVNQMVRKHADGIMAMRKRMIERRSQARRQQSVVAALSRAAEIDQFDVRVDLGKGLRHSPRRPESRNGGISGLAQKWRQLRSKPVPGGDEHRHKPLAMERTHLVQRVLELVLHS